jgi:hypothetical protein
MKNPRTPPPHAALLERIDLARDGRGQLWLEVSVRGPVGRMRAARVQLPEKTSLPQRLREVRALREKLLAKPARARTAKVDRRRVPEVETIREALAAAVDAAAQAFRGERAAFAEDATGSMWAGALGRVGMRLHLADDMRWVHRLRKAADLVPGATFSFDAYNHVHDLTIQGPPEMWTQEITPRYVGYLAAAEELQQRLGLHPSVWTQET